MSPYQQSTTSSNPKVTIIGTTTWGTTLGIILARKGIPVAIITRTEHEARELSIERKHTRFLPGVDIPQSIYFSHDLNIIKDYQELVIIAVPSDRFRHNVQWVKNSLTPGSLILSVTKGLELPNGKRMSQILKEELPLEFHPDICSLSGPNLAKEIVDYKPASTVVAGSNDTNTASIQNILMSPTFRVYTSSDLVGLELCGTLKNILAIGVGIADGLSIGDNGKSTLITRGLSEIRRLGVAAGGESDTFYGLAGLGDIIATCSSPFSRNRYVGERLAQGQSLTEIQTSMQNVAEGVNTTCAALEMAHSLGIEMPITQAIYDVLFEQLSPIDAIKELMSRPARSE